MKIISLTRLALKDKGVLIQLLTLIIAIFMIGTLIFLLLLNTSSQPNPPLEEQPTSPAKQKLVI
ncbi:MAG: hypothetical protein HZC02_05000, partial [Candidatus Levybacteria bacterium]|nr:hypothetical protein [Candidatus Levybacteria bacterium]